jgi:aconitate hydratase 2/2-methylisocitrate dehydratase
VCSKLGRIPSKEEYLADVAAVNANGDEIYKYMNFHQIDKYQEIASTLVAG